MTDFRFNKPLTKEEIDALKQEKHPEMMALRADAVLATFAQYNERIASLQAEVDVLRGVDCEADGDGPCGVCIKCAKKGNLAKGPTE